MKRTLLSLLFTLGMAGAAMAATAPVDTIKGDITKNRTLYRDTVYVLKGFVYVKENSGATLTIQPGTIIKGDKTSKGALIVERGARIYAVGTKTAPIVFTSSQPVGKRNTGDWGGVILCGKATVNSPGGETQIEGGPRSFYGGKTTADDNDSSGALKYVRIEFCGIAFVPNSEINGLTLGAVGKKTMIDYVQVSWSGDDGFEWFGGNVNCKHLISYGSLDDDFDTDFGYSGKVQYGLILRDQGSADVSGSHAFESDGYKTNYNINNPFTRVIFSNVTAMGPLFENADVTGVNPLFKTAAQIRRNSRLSLLNSVIAGWPYGLTISQLQVDSVMNGNATVANGPTAGDNLWEGLVLEGNKDTFVSDAAGYAGNGLDAAKINTERMWFNAAGKSNRAHNMSASTSKFFATELGTQNSWGFDYNTDTNLAISNFSVMPKSGSMLLSGATFSNARVSSDAWFDKVSYVGAFDGTNDWTSGWAKFNPQTEPYTEGYANGIEAVTFNAEVNLYPNPAQNSTSLNVELEKSTMLTIAIYDLNGRMISMPYSGNAGLFTKVDCNTQNLSNGIYLVKVSGSEGSKTLKLVISGK